MHKGLAILILVAIFLSGCTSRYLVTADSNRKETGTLSVGEFNERIQDKTMTVVLTTGREYDADRIRVRGDSLIFQAGSSFHISRFSEIRYVIDVSPTTGIILGLLGGSIGGLLLGQAIGSNSDGFWGGFGGAITGFVVGGVAGLTFGIFNPPTVQYEFDIARE